MTETEKRTHKVCRVCGARYSGGSQAASGHTRATSHNDWQRKAEIVERGPLVISYLPV